MKVNDVYKIRLKPEYRTESFLWTFECLLIAQLYKSEILLFDTWGGTSGNHLLSGHSFAPTQEISNKFDNCFKVVTDYGKLEFLGNLDDYKLIPEYETKYYSDNDILILTRQHACTKSCIEYYLKKDAKRDINKITENIKNEIETADRTLKSAIQNKEKYESMLSDIENNKIDIDKMWL